MKQRPTPPRAATTRKRRAPAPAAPRPRATKGAAKRSAAKAAQRVDALRLVHELEIHRLELEAQNDELRAARAAVDAALQRYTELFDFAPIGYVVLDADGRIRECNLEGARMLALPRARLDGQRFGIFVAEAQRRALTTFLDGMRKGPLAVEHILEATFCPAGVAPLNIRLNASALEGTEPRTLVAMTDITELKAAEREMREDSRRKDQFLATLSHELRNPLAPIRTSVALLRRGSPPKEEVARITAVVDRQVGHLARIVDDLLDVSRIASGKIHLQRERTDLREIVSGAIDDHQDDFAASRVALQMNPSRRGDIWVDVDRTRIAQVVDNLIGNALKFTLPGGHVTVQVHLRAGRAEITVSDDGIGIANEIRDHLFEPFVQAPQSLDRARGGLGLGLAMVKGFVELHSGTVSAESRGPGLGSTFVVRLPLAAALDDTPVSSEGPSSAPSPTKRRVLLIEDSIDSAEAMKTLLEFEGHDVRVAHDGASGIALARLCRPEVVICDIGLPGMDGYDVAREMRADAMLQGARLVALSGYARHEDRRAAMAAGFDGHLAKPPDLRQLEALLAQPVPLDRNGPALGAR